MAPCIGLTLVNEVQVGAEDRRPRQAGDRVGSLI